ncbi:ABC transporter ATP-binding protein [Roseomonas sp. OT10]|uniref:ABC transporter ATP-binding protein n=1 Tax=Roseomonas cutis TaxID=2897332 RepID=UPI001E38388E|nr:ABC transporter ATP-binding protein [Roseomonas sp. OT10]UFN48272.1 ABC transporter ATP-binding protein [Roseomonas sp. OT10]
MSPRIEVVDLTKTYRREGGEAITPVDDVSLSVGAEELVVLLGPSGCGKTTLLRCVAGLERPDRGRIVVDGRTVFCSRQGIWEPAERRRLSMIFQSFALWPHMTVFENVAYPLRCRKVAQPEVARRVAEVLALAGIGGLSAQYPGRISGGQQQRVALARALVAGSNVVLFDEPLSNVDAQVRAQLRFELKVMQARIGFSGLYVTHDQTEAMELGHRVAVLERGRIAALGRPRDIYENPNSEYVAAFVGTANIWPGRIAAMDDRLVTVETGAGPLRAARAHLPDGMQPGSDVSVVVRPEQIRLGDGTGEANRLPGRVEASLFAGPHTEVVVRAGECQLRLWSAEDQADLAAGQEVVLAIAPERVRIVPRGAVPAAEARAA